jgi:DNA-directed RNA polymerase specialized sigma24 family protein
VDYVVGDVQWRVFTGLQKLSPPPPPAWYLTLAQRAVSDYYRKDKQRRFPMVPDGEKQIPQTPDTAREPHIRIGIDQFLQQVRPLLAPQDQDLLSLLRSDQTRHQIRSSLGIESKNFPTTYKRSLARIKEAMQVAAFLETPGDTDERCDYLSSITVGALSPDLRREISRHIAGTKNRPACARCQKRRPDIDAQLRDLARAVPIVLPLAPLPRQPMKTRAMETKRGLALQAALVAATATAIMMLPFAGTLGREAIAGHGLPTSWPSTPPATSGNPPASPDQPTRSKYNDESPTPDHNQKSQPTKPSAISATQRQQPPFRSKPPHPQ